MFCSRQKSSWSHPGLKIFSHKSQRSKKNHVGAKKRVSCYSGGRMKNVLMERMRRKMTRRWPSVNSGTRPFPGLPNHRRHHHRRRRRRRRLILRGGLRNASWNSIPGARVACASVWVRACVGVGVGACVCVGWAQTCARTSTPNEEVGRRRVPSHLGVVLRVAVDASKRTFIVIPGTTNKLV